MRIWGRGSEGDPRRGVWVVVAGVNARYGAPVRAIGVGLAVGYLLVAMVWVIVGAVFGLPISRRWGIPTQRGKAMNRLGPMRAWYFSPSGRHRTRMQVGASGVGWFAGRGVRLCVSY